MKIMNHFVPIFAANSERFPPVNSIIPKKARSHTEILRSISLQIYPYKFF